MQEVSNNLTERIQTLTVEQLAAVEEFIEELQSTWEHEALSRACAAQSEAAFGAIWNNPEDDVYDEL